MDKVKNMKDKRSGCFESAKQKVKKIKTDFWIILSSIIIIVMIGVLSGEDTCFIWFFEFFLDPVMGVLTFLVAVFLGYRTWTSKLPQKVTVHYKYNNKYVYTCHKAYLSGEGDIRPWGQQIGKQMNDGKLLDFYPYIEQRPPVIKRVDNKRDKFVNYFKWLFSDRFYKHYVVTFFLYKPAQHNNSYTISWDNNVNTPNNKSIRIENSDWQFEITESEAEAIAQEKKEQRKKEYIVYRNQEPKEIVLDDVKIIEKGSADDEEGKRSKKIFINLSNHPSSGWSDAQKKTAEEAFGEIQDLSFPNISPTINTDDLDDLVKEYLNKIVEMQPAAVHIAGEPVFVFRLVSALKAKRIKCVSSTTERMVHEEAGKKISVFQFVNFRDY